jgi:hypothetical protein
MNISDDFHTGLILRVSIYYGFKKFFFNYDFSYFVLKFLIPMNCILDRQIKNHSLITHPLFPIRTLHLLQLGEALL